MSTKILSTILVTVCFLSCSSDEDFTNQYVADKMQAVSDEQAYVILENFVTRDSNGLFNLNISAEGANIYNISTTAYYEAVKQIETLNLHLSIHPQYASLHQTPFYLNQHTRAAPRYFDWIIDVSRDELVKGTIGIPNGYDYETKVPFKCRELYLYLSGKGDIYIKQTARTVKKYTLNKYEKGKYSYIIMVK